MNIKVEKVTIEDTKKLLEIYAPYVLNTAISFEYDLPTLEEFAGRIETITSKYPYIKATADGVIFGYAYASTFKARPAYDWSVETTIYIKQDARGNGIGRMLYETLEKSLKEMGIINMNACIAVAKENDPYLTNASKCFHEKMGFSIVGTFHNSGHKFDTWYDMIWMEKILGIHNDNPNPVKFGCWTI